MADMSYPSKYSNTKTVSAAQYITEIICEHKAIREKRDLHFRFWLNKEWAKFFRDQIATANKLVKKYPANAIIKALNSNQGLKIYSLRAPHLVGIIEQCVEQIQKETEAQKDAGIVNRVNIETYQHRKNKSSNILSKLKELEDES
jgi:hypothetical protein